MEFSLRDGQSADFEALWRVDQECFPPGIAYSRFELGAYIKRARAFTIVAESDGDDARERRGMATVISGFIVAESNRRTQGHIITIDVLPKYRRSGLGSRLLLAAEQRLRSIPCHSVILEAAVDNASAIAFYKQHGYHVVRTIPRYYPDNVDALVLEKDLSPAETHRAAN